MIFHGSLLPGVAVALLAVVAGGLAGEEGNFSVPAGDRTVRFDYRLPEGGGEAVLLLIPPLNGNGRSMLTGRWRAFADRHRLALLAPTFRATEGELADRKGYYYPEQWSGEAVEKALDGLRGKGVAAADRILIFGFSAGAHFAHRFAAWKPERVAAFAAGGAAWWDEPGISAVPALIFCGEGDFRLDACRRYFLAGQMLEFPWVWRSYSGVGHDVSPGMQRLAEAFFECHLPASKVGKECYGDMQTYETASEKDEIPEVVRVRLPSEEFAEIWRREE